MVCVIITGSRKLKGFEHGAAIRDVFVKLYENTSVKHVIVLHGDADGADRMAERWARSFVFETLAVPYIGKDSGGGHARNMCLIELAKVLEGYGYHVVCHAFPLRTSKGTYGCMELAEKAGFECHEHLQEA